MTANLKDHDHLISEEEYLKGELTSEIKHEYIDGYVYAMSGASKNHNRIAGNIFLEFGNHLKKTPCEPFTSDMKVKVGSKYFYPDVTVVCDDKTQAEYYTESPTILVEVLSKSTRRRDEKLKRMIYQTIPTLQEYVLIEQDFVDVEVCRCSEGWVSNHFFLGDEVTFESIALTVSVEEIYARVENEDVRTYFEEKAALTKEKTD
ncbi:MAG: Uma2 family endonuclease [Proteobacteria bacterium]|nr:Uma2 family endonuclease [Pseudomonadota bacterium]